MGRGDTHPIGATGTVIGSLVADRFRVMTDATRSIFWPRLSSGAPDRLPI
jgi:hypothetical protein